VQIPPDRRCLALSPSDAWPLSYFPRRLVCWPGILQVPVSFSSFCSFWSMGKSHASTASGNLHPAAMSESLGVLHRAVSRRFAGGMAGPAMRC